MIGRRQARAGLPTAVPTLHWRRPARCTALAEGGSVEPLFDPGPAPVPVRLWCKR